VRWHRPDSAEAGEWAIDQQGREAEIRQACRDAIQPIFEDSLRVAPTIERPMVRRLAQLAEVAAIGRTKIIRSNFGGREIEFVPEAEANTRIAKGLAGIARGIAALNQHEQVQEDDLQDAFRVGLECLPDLRKELLLTAFRREDLNELGNRTTRERAIGELEALGLFTPGRVISEAAARLLHAAGLRH
jgi:hypothetical protein